MCGSWPIPGDPSTHQIMFVSYPLIGIWYLTLLSSLLDLILNVLLFSKQLEVEIKQLKNFVIHIRMKTDPLLSLSLSHMTVINRKQAFLKSSLPIPLHAHTHLHPKLRRESTALVFTTLPKFQTNPSLMLLSIN